MAMIKLKSPSDSLKGIKAFDELEQQQEGERVRRGEGGGEKKGNALNDSAW